MDIVKITKSCLLDQDITLKDLVGKHYLSGVEFDGNDIIFVLNDIAFVAREDPQDGYRSSMDRLDIYTGIVKNRFEGVEVIAKLSSDLLSLIDCDNEKEVLIVGTDYSDSYYPFFVHEWMPQNLSLNWKCGTAATAPASNTGKG